MGFSLTLEDGSLRFMLYGPAEEGMEILAQDRVLDTTIDDVDLDRGREIFAMDGFDKYLQPSEMLGDALWDIDVAWQDGGPVDLLLFTGDEHTRDLREYLDGVILKYWTASTLVDAVGEDDAGAVSP